nr:immunoglobulin heavy chain junction region [Mus musculus]
YVFLCENTG